MHNFYSVGKYKIASLLKIPFLHSKESHDEVQKGEEFSCII